MECPEEEKTKQSYFIRKGLEDVEVSREEYYRESEKLFRIKLMVMDQLGLPPLTQFSDLSKTKQTRYKDMVMRLMDDLTYEEVREQSGDVIDDVFSTNPKELPIKLV